MATELHYQVVEPADAANPPLTVVVIHGRGSNEEEFLRLGRRLQLPLRWVGVRAWLPVPGGEGWQWFRFPRPGLPEAEDFQRSLDGLVALVQDVRESYSLAADRLVLAGFSQGAVMALGVAMTVPEHIGGVVAMSGYFPRPGGEDMEAGNVRGLPVLVTHGSADSVLPVEWGREAAARLHVLGARVEYREFHGVGHELTPPVLEAVRGWLRAMYEREA